jgi:hypothetical protein
MDTSEAAGTASSKTMAKTTPRRLDGLPVPFEVSLQIHSFSSPFDLGRLLRVSHLFRLNALECIKYYELSFDPQESYHVDDDVLHGMLKSLKGSAQNSRHINLLRCFGVTNKGLASIAAACTSLRSIQLGGTLSFVLRHVDDEGIAALAEQCPHLEELRISQAYLTAAGIKALATKAPTQKALEWRKRHFKTIDISNCSKINDEAVPWLCEFEGLTSLGLGGCRHISAAGILALFENLPSPSLLRSVRLHGLFKSLDAENIKMFAQKCGKTIRELDLSGNRLADRTVKDLCTYFQGGHLTILSLRRSSISPTALCKFLSTCGGKLKSLDLENSKPLKNHGTKILACCVSQCPKIVHLDLTNLTFSESSLGLLCTPGAPQLQFLSISLSKPDPLEQVLPTSTTPTSHFSDKAVVQVVQHLPDLRGLKIQGSCNLSGGTVATILKECKCISKLDVGSTLRTSREGDKLLKYLGQKHLQLNLKHLRLSVSSFGMVCGPGTVLEFSASEWNNAGIGREQLVKSLLKARPHLKIDIFGSDCL